MRAVLPVDVEVAATPGGELVDAAKVLSPQQLEAWNSVAPDTLEDRWKYFEPHEADIARWLDGRGVRVRSVREFKKRRSPDAVTAGDHPVPIEFKTLNPADGRTYSHSQCKKNVREASAKCRRVVVDARTTRATVEQAGATVVEIIRENGANLDEIVLIVERGTAVAWRRG